MKNLEKFDKSILFLVVAIVVSFGVITLLFNQIVEGAESVRESKKNIQITTTTLDRYGELAEVFEKIEEEGIIEEIINALPTTDDFIFIVNELEEIADLSGNQIAMSLGEAKLTSEGYELGATTLQQNASGTEFDDYDSIEIEVTVRGDYESLYRFVDLISQAEYYMNINEMRIARIDASEGPYLHTNMNIEIFVQKVIYKDPNSL